MSITASASFIANYQTRVIFGRALTESEQSQLTAVRLSTLTAGRQCSVSVTPQETGITTSNWSNVEDADSYAAVANAFSPAPTTACTVAAV